MKKVILLSMLVTLIVPVMVVCGADCARFRGPAGDGIFQERGLLKQWPEGGPKLAWSVTGLGHGFSSAVVVDGTVYVTGMDGQNQGHLFAFNLDGSPKWKVPYGPELPKKGPAVAGTRGTPNVSGDRMFLVSGFARLYMIDPENGNQ